MLFTLTFFSTKKLPAVVKVPVANSVATGTGKNRDQGPIFSNETRIARLLASLTTYREVI